ncbi:membrane protein RL11G [Cercopithecine betaherpesvirus 5]|uniref:Membrane protein RL11G n=1 Tax=Simian cytomegalovirus (strain Colburn) TaxID=50292 RepID=G8XT74_SCMVC|nr:membrane protein RL11G [Cercopithecine betaherpesvirus 5]AEV80367.1 membrane protein RL11G [Cercopithecine betaherpesvirus 5]
MVLHIVWQLLCIHTILAASTSNESTCNLQCNCNNTCGFVYNVTHASGYEHSNVTLHTSLSHNTSDTHVGHWIRYNFPATSYALYSVSGNRVAKERHDDWCFECNSTSLTICNLGVNQTGSYIFKDIMGLTEHYTVTVLPIPPPPAPKVTTVTNCSLIFFNEYLWRNASFDVIPTTTTHKTSTTTRTTTTTSTTHRTTAGRSTTHYTTTEPTTSSDGTTWPPDKPKFISKYSKLATFAAWSAGMFSVALVIFLIVFVCALFKLKQKENAKSRLPTTSSVKEKDKKKKSRSGGPAYQLITEKQYQTTSCAVEKSMFS